MCVDLLLLLLIRVCVLLVVETETTEAIILDVASGKVKCLTEDLRGGSLSQARYHVLNANASRISARVSDPTGHVLHHSDSVQSGHFHFQAAATGLHTACFWSPQFEPTMPLLSVDVQWNNNYIVAARSHHHHHHHHHNSSNAKETYMAMTELKNLEATINLIHHEMIFLRDSQRDAHRFTQQTASTITSLGLFSLALCLAVAAVQLWHLNTFFHNKKLL